MEADGERKGLSECNQLRSVTTWFFDDRDKSRSCECRNFARSDAAAALSSEAPTGCWFASLTAFLMAIARSGRPCLVLVEIGNTAARGRMALHALKNSSFFASTSGRSICRHEGEGEKRCRSEVRRDVREGKASEGK